jgi:hypothetical protein
VEQSGSTCFFTASRQQSVPGRAHALQVSVKGRRKMTVRTPDPGPVQRRGVGNSRNHGLSLRWIQHRTAGSMPAVLFICHHSLSSLPPFCGGSVFLDGPASYIARPVRAVLWRQPAAVGEINESNKVIALPAIGGREARRDSQIPADDLRQPDSVVPSNLRALWMHSRSGRSDDD